MNSRDFSRPEVFKTTGVRSNIFVVPHCRRIWPQATKAAGGFVRDGMATQRRNDLLFVLLGNESQSLQT
ncbi:MAG: hypothetical protein EOP50_06015 [Sphingobacteriales bacterium]|nr:MAG: hypothetical protein EOP50_06015 [Sphingobacteriales bacterium]